jgi:hypothetical protein
MALSRRFTFPTLGDNANPHRDIARNRVSRTGEARCVAQCIIYLDVLISSCFSVFFCAVFHERSRYSSHISKT